MPLELLSQLTSVRSSNSILAVVVVVDIIQVVVNSYSEHQVSVFVGSDGVSSGVVDPPLVMEVWVMIRNNDVVFMR